MKIELSFENPLVVISTPPAKAELRAIFTVQYNDVKFKGENMASEMKSGSLATVSVSWTDTGGNSVPVDGPTSWESSDPSIVAVTVATGNPLIANLSSPGPIGTATIQASADADMGQGVRKVYATYDINVVKGDAIGGTITFSQSSDQPTPPSPGGPRR